MRPSAEAIDIIIWREWILATGAQDTVKLTPSSMDDIYAHVLEKRSYWLSVSVVFTQKDIMGLSIFISGGSKERKNGALKVMDVAMLSLIENIESYNSYPRGLLTKSPIWSGVGGFVGRQISLFPMNFICLI